MPIKVADDLVLYDVEALSELLKVGPKTIRQLFRDGKLKGRKVARKWYATEAELRAFFSQTEPAARQEASGSGH